MEAPLIYKNMTQIMKQVGVIGKEKTNTQQGFKYRGIDDVMNELHSLFAENNVFIAMTILSIDRQERTNSKGTLIFSVVATIEYRFIAEDGSEVKTIALGEAMDSGDKATNKAMSIALKYALLQMFLIPTEELKDPDSEVHEVKPDKSPKKLDEKALEAAIDSMKSQSSLDGVKNIWSEFKCFQQNKKFIDAKEMMKIALTTNQ